MSVHMTCPGGEAINWVKEFFYLEICVCVCVYVCVLKKVWTGHVGENSYDLRVQWSHLRGFEGLLLIYIIIIRLYIIIVIIIQSVLFAVQLVTLLLFG